MRGREKIKFPKNIDIRADQGRERAKKKGNLG
jgi:hypothetical protein